MVIKFEKSDIKKIAITIICIVVICTGYLTFKHFSTGSTKKDLVSNLNKAGYISAIMVNDYTNAMGESFDYGEILNEYGNTNIAATLNGALSNRLKYYQNIGITQYLDSLKTVMQKQMKYVKSNSKEDLAFTSAFENVTKLVNLALTPTGSYLTFVRDTNDYFSNFSSSMDQIGVYYKVAPKDSVIIWSNQLIKDKYKRFYQKNKGKIYFEHKP